MGRGRQPKEVLMLQLRIPPQKTGKIGVSTPWGLPTIRAISRSVARRPAPGADGVVGGDGCSQSRPGGDELKGDLCPVAQASIALQYLSGCCYCPLFRRCRTKFNPFLTIAAELRIRWRLDENSLVRHRLASARFMSLAVTGVPDSLLQNIRRGIWATPQGGSTRALQRLPYVLGPWASRCAVSHMMWSHS